MPRTNSGLALNLRFYIVTNRIVFTEIFWKNLHKKKNKKPAILQGRSAPVALLLADIIAAHGVYGHIGYYSYL